MIDIKFIGTGGAFDHAVGNSAALVYLNGKTILLDCGHSVYPTLAARNLQGKIDYILITHLHDDHAGSLSTMLYYHHFFQPQTKAKLIYQDLAFKKLLTEYLTFSMNPPDNYIDWIRADEIEGLTCIDTHGLHVPDMPTWAFLFQSKNDSVLFSGDIGDADYLFKKMEQMKIKPRKVFHEMTFFPNVAVHAYYKELEKHSQEYTIYGYHVNPLLNPADNSIPLVCNVPEYNL